jgi:tetratricopeptide (TPR) repeat protein
MTAQSRNAEGVRLYDQSRYQDAIQQFEQALANDPDNPDAYYNLAAVYHRLGVLTGDPAQMARAEDHYNMCRYRDNNHRECYRGLAVLLVEQERSEEAFRLLESWVASNPTSAEPKVELARLYEEFGDPQAAKQHLVEALYSDSKNPRALAALGQLREQLGEHELALKNYQDSLWHDRFQPDVAARVATLQSTMSQPGVPSTAPPPTAPAPQRTRLVTRNPGLLR